MGSIPGLGAKIPTCCAVQPKKKKKIRNKETEAQRGDIICLGSHSY